ncbi:hypothetical protein GGS20DRAFT_590262 [Poronia punctata]|nr:hypothetical protein GGS20DRAFT_590262 [Poronia punctata]
MPSNSARRARNATPPEITTNNFKDVLKHFDHSGRLRDKRTRIRIDCDVCYKRLAIVNPDLGLSVDENVRYEHYVVLECGHAFGYSCLHTWVQAQRTRNPGGEYCPSCRHPLRCPDGYLHGLEPRRGWSITGFVDKDIREIREMLWQHEIRCPPELRGLPRPWPLPMGPFMTPALPRSGDEIPVPVPVPVATTRQQPDNHGPRTPVSHRPARDERQVRIPVPRRRGIGLYHSGGSPAIVSAVHPSERVHTAPSTEVPSLGGGPQRHHHHHHHHRHRHRHRGHHNNVGDDNYNYYYYYYEEHSHRHIDDGDRHTDDSGNLPPLEVYRSRSQDGRHDDDDRNRNRRSRPTSSLPGIETQRIPSSSSPPGSSSVLSAGLEDWLRDRDRLDDDDDDDDDGHIVINSSLSSSCSCSSLDSYVTARTRSPHESVRSYESSGAYYSADDGFGAGGW